MWRCWKPKERFSLCSELSTRSSAARGRRLLQRTSGNSSTRTLGELGQEGEDTARRLCENVQEGEGPAGCGAFPQRLIPLDLSGACGNADCAGGLAGGLRGACGACGNVSVVFRRSNSSLHLLCT